MRSEVVVVPTFQREELLFLSLESIRRADPNIPVQVYSDRGYWSRDLMDTCIEFGAHLRVIGKHDHYGNSWNLLSAMESTLIIEQPEILHIVEDDTIINPAYFDWAAGTLSSGVVASAYAHMSSDDTRKDWYESPCASWSGPKLREALGMIPEGYFTKHRDDMLKALDRQFPGSKMRGNGAEQDSFFLRVIENREWITRHPDRPLAQHIGWYGYNRPEGSIPPHGEFPERVAACREMLGNREMRTIHFGKPITDLEFEGAAQ